MRNNGNKEGLGKRVEGQGLGGERYGEGEEQAGKCNGGTGRETEGKRVGKVQGQRGGKRKEGGEREGEPAGDE